MVVEASTTVVTTSTAERCDRCGARALVRTTFASGEQLHELLWCGHHFAANEAKIREQAVLVQDERDEMATAQQPVN
jgi:hypothetical protein